MPINTKEKQAAKNTTGSASRYIEAVGRRKTAVARVRISENKKESYDVNTKSLEEYFPTHEMQMLVRNIFTEAKLSSQFAVTARIKGGGLVAQSEALRHGIARALVLRDETLRKTLKKAGFLKRDPRMKERKKFGLKKARKAPQWSKR